MNRQDTLSAAVIAEEINNKKLVQNKNNIPVLSAQVLEYARNHPENFRVNENMVSLKKFPLNEDLVDNDTGGLLKSYFNRMASYAEDDKALFDTLVFGMVGAMVIRHLAKENNMPEEHKPDQKYINTNVFENKKHFLDFLSSINKQGIYRGLFDNLLQEEMIIETTLSLLFKLNISLKNEGGYGQFIEKFDRLYLNYNYNSLPEYFYYLLPGLCFFKGNETIYDPACDNGFLLAKTYMQNNKVRIFLQETDEEKLIIARLNLLLHACFTFTSYKGDPIYKPGVFSNKMDVVLSIPPGDFIVKPGKMQKFPFEHIAWENAATDLYIQMMKTRLNFKGQNGCCRSRPFLIQKIICTGAQKNVGRGYY